jgi:excisionase family DNA binding protein
MPTVSDLLPVSEAARRAGVSRDTLIAWADAGYVAAVRTKLGRLIVPGDLERLIREREQGE